MAATFRVALVSITILSCLSAAFLNHLLSFEATFKSRWEPLHTAVQLKKKCTCIVKDGFHRSRVPMQKHTKHGFISLVIPGHDPPLDITVYVDISTNPGPAQSIITIGSRQRATRDLIRQLDSPIRQTTTLQYSRRELVSLRKNYSLQERRSVLFKNIRADGIFKYRGKRSGRLTKTKLNTGRSKYSSETNEFSTLNNYSQSNNHTLPGLSVIPVRTTTRTISSSYTRPRTVNCYNSSILNESLRFNNHALPRLSTIPVRVTTRVSSSRYTEERAVNFNNLAIIKPKRNIDARKNTLQFVPSIAVSNVMSLAPKIDELRIFLNTHEFDLCCITETWLKDSIDDSVVDISGYNIIRKDRTHKLHGGVALYVKDSIQFSILRDYEFPDPEGPEVLWAKITPNRLPRGYSCLIIGTVYHPPPPAKDEPLLDYMMDSLSRIESDIPGAGIILAGDWNRANVSPVIKHFRLTQVVHFPTRGDRTLDKVLTNLTEHYEKPSPFPPFGLSDHCTVGLFPKIRSKANIPANRTVTTRTVNAESKQAFGRYMTGVDWSLIDTIDSVQEQYAHFSALIHIGLDSILPKKRVKFHRNDAPWISPKLKALIAHRQRAYYQDNKPLFHYYRNKVNRERKLCKRSYYNTKVSVLTENNPKMWWSECRRLCGMNKTSTSVANQLLASKPATSINLKILANEINTALLEPQASFDPLLDNIETVSTEGFKTPIISLETTFKCLSTVSSSKAGGPDNIPNWVLRDFAPELAQPLRCIINSSISQGTLPDFWKCANITPLPKTKIVEDAAKDLRPISLTPTLSKIAEHYVVHEHVKPALLKRLEPDQFGCIPGSSTAHALINLMHNWAQATDGTGNTVRIFALDYRKAFDLIDHSLLLSKLSTYNINPYIINWIIAFLKDRKQRVKLAHDCLSEWGSVRAGVPQGTKLGPWLFLVMINDLKVPSASDCIKYVDDTTVYEIISKGGPSNAQSMINEVATWSTLNSFQLHPKKCNELRVSFVRSPPSYDLIEINGSKVSAFSVVKLLGVYFQDNLKWNTHVTEMIKKAAKRLYFLTQLKRAKVPSPELVNFYVACIQSVLLYGCQVYHYSLPDYLSLSLERVQKRALKIIYGYDNHYREVLQMAELKTLRDRREDLCLKFFNNIVSNPLDCLYHLLPFDNRDQLRELRRRRPFRVSFKTNRFRDTFIPASARHFN